MLQSTRVASTSRQVIGGPRRTVVCAELSSKQKKSLRAIAQRLQSEKRLYIMQIGKNGVTDSVKKALDEALAARELVKIKVGDGSDDDEDIVGELLKDEVNAEIVGTVGHTVLFARLKPRSESNVMRMLEAADAAAAASPVRSGATPAKARDYDGN